MHMGPFDQSPPCAPCPSPGSCGYGYLFKNEPLGWDVAAATDFMPGYEDVSYRHFHAPCSQ